MDIKKLSADKANNIHKLLMATGQWGPIEIDLGIEFGFCCAYCGKDFFESVDNYKDWQKDHIVPQSMGGIDSIENYALSCRVCNFIKGTWNPLHHADCPSPSKQHLIQLAKDHILEKRLLVQQEIDSYRQIVEDNKQS